MINPQTCLLDWMHLKTGENEATTHFVRHSRRVQSLVWAVFILSSGCSSLANQSIKVRSVESLNLNGISDGHLVLDAGVRVENRSAGALTMEDVRVELTLGNRVLPGTVVEIVQLTPGTQTIAYLPMHISLNRVDEELLVLLTDPNSAYSAELSARTLPGIPAFGVTLSGRLNQTERPTLRLGESLGASMITVEEIRDVSIGFLGVSAQVMVTVSNPFHFDLHLDGLRYSLTTKGVDLGHGKLGKNNGIVPAQGHRVLVMRHRAPWPLGAIRSPSAFLPPLKLEIQGTIELGGRLHGRTIPFEARIDALSLAEDG